MLFSCSSGKYESEDELNVDPRRNGGVGHVFIKRSLLALFPNHDAAYKPLKSYMTRVKSCPSGSCISGWFGPLKVYGSSPVLHWLSYRKARTAAHHRRENQLKSLCTFPQQLTQPNLQPFRFPLGSQPFVNMMHETERKPAC